MEAPQFRTEVRKLFEKFVEPKDFHARDFRLIKKGKNTNEDSNEFTSEINKNRI